MKQLTINQGRFRLSDSQTLTVPSITIKPGQSWALIGANGSGKSALAKALADELILLNGEYRASFSHIVRLSFEQLQKLISEEWLRNNTDLLSADEDDTGRTAQEVITEEAGNRPEQSNRCYELAEQFGISHLLHRRFKYLSTGETRKTLLCRAMISSPDLLILDEPFDGLDAESRQQLTLILAQLHYSGVTLVLVLNRFSEAPDFVNNIGILTDCHLARVGEKASIMTESLIAQLAHAEQLNDADLPAPDSLDSASILAPDCPRIILKNGRVHYNDKAIIEGLDWQVDPGQHWHIVGPNGAGKSTLLSLITGDHPQGYSNNLTLFSRRRGTGETIWEIKRHIGYVSSSLHLDYRINVSVRNVILSGYFDSIGVYQAASDKQLNLTQQWLTLLGMDNYADSPFHDLSWGQQRLILIARALVKHPTLLILDEPLQGLDSLNRQMIKTWIDLLIRRGQTQLLFVSHHAEDAPQCITHRLHFILDTGGYRYEKEIV